jgi:hypothetical protein
MTPVAWTGLLGIPREQGDPSVRGESTCAPPARLGHPRTPPLRGDGGAVSVLQRALPSSPPSSRLSGSDPPRPALWMTFWRCVTWLDSHRLRCRGVSRECRRQRGGGVAGILVRWVADCGGHGQVSRPGQMSGELGLFTRESRKYTLIAVEVGGPSGGRSSEGQYARRQAMRVCG